MTKTVVAVYDSFKKAHRVVDELERNGFARADISVVAYDASGQYARFIHEGAVPAEDEDVDAGEGAGFGAMVGAMTGLLVGLGSLAIPGIGPVIAGGPIIAALAGGTVGAAAGAATGGIVAALVDMGVDEPDAGVYAETVRRGGTMVAVTARDDTAEHAAAIMRSQNPVDVDATANLWRDQGWEHYIEGDEPYAAEHPDHEQLFVVADNVEAGVIRTYSYRLFR